MVKFKNRKTHVETRVATFLGIVTGSAMAVIDNIIVGVCTAVITGAAAYAGQQIAKYIHHRLKHRKHK